MKASEFFKNHIRDNDYRLERIQPSIHLVENFNCDTDGTWKKNRESIRKAGVESFLKGIRRSLESYDLASASVRFINKDKEFDANQDQKLIEVQGDSFENFRIKTGNIVGSFVYKGNQLNINCRFGNAFLEYMIANTSGFIELENFGGKSSDIGLGEWILILYWKMQLKRAFAHGLYKTYKKKTEEISTIRGTIDINAFIRKKAFDGKTTCTFTEHSYENNINRVIKAAINKVAKSKFNMLISDVLEIKRAFDSIHFESRGIQVLESKVKNPYYVNYNEVYKLSRDIIEDRFLSYNNPTNEFSAFLFDVSLLFEHHIRKVLKAGHQLHEKNKVEFKVPNGIDVNNIFSDVVIDYGDNKIGVFDVKYKNFRSYGKDRGVNREDRFQLISYLALYSSKYEVINSGIIYPCRENEYKQLTAVVSTKNQHIDIAKNKVPFRIYFYQVNQDFSLQRKYDQEFLNEFYHIQPTPELIDL